MRKKVAKKLAAMTLSLNLPARSTGHVHLQIRPPGYGHPTPSPERRPPDLTAAGENPSYFQGRPTGFAARRDLKSQSLHELQHGYVLREDHAHQPPDAALTGNGD